jgi:Fe-S cluster assembly iron-binding protein IscA
VFDVALDEPTEKDQVFRTEDYKIIMRKELAEKINSVEIFFKEGISKSGFRVLTDISWQYSYRFEDWAR